MRKTIVLVALICVIGGAVAGELAFAHSAAGASKKARLQVRKGKLGRFIVDAKGMTLYLFQKDKGKTSACYGSCAKVWAPYLTSGTPTAATGVSASKAGTTKRTDGTTQVTYGGHPLYHYDDDKKPGQTEGQGSKAFGAEWYVLGTNGKKIDKS